MLTKAKTLIGLVNLAGPLSAAITVVLFWNDKPDTLEVVFINVVLIGGVLSAVHHAEVIAAYVGRAIGALILALAVTVIEVGLIVAIMLSSDGAASTLGRDTVFAAIMITCNGIVGFSIVIASLKNTTLSFNSEGSGAALSAITTIATLSLVLPVFTRGSAGPTFTFPQLVFVSFASLVVYGLFLYVLTVRNREHFEDPDAVITMPYAKSPSKRDFHRSITLLLIALVAIIGMAKVISPSIEGVVVGAGLPIFVIAVVVALVVLAPESLAAMRAASRGDLQTGFNLAYGSALASIGLTIPTLAIVSSIIDINLILGLSATELVLFVLTCVVSVVTVSSHRVTFFQGGLHLVIFFSFLFLAFAP
ncbi:MAG: ionic transporter y4hA [Actinobacteria bacterium]|nr:ionic transporter y4hA [Actinomycetota bacterium]